jgi:hypothetical protein
VVSTTDSYGRILGFVDRKLHKKELNNLYFCPVIIMMMKWRRTRKTDRVKHMGKKRSAYKTLV